MIFVCPVANPGGSAFHLVARVKVSPRVPEVGLTCSNSLISGAPGRPARS